MDHQLGIPAENPQPQIEADNMAPGLGSMASFQSVQSVQSHHEDERIGGQQDLQIVQSRHDRRINQEEIVRMFNEQLQKQEREKQEIELKRRQSLKSKPKTLQKPHQKKVSHEEKKSNKENNTEKLQALSERSARIRKRIQQFCKEYKSMYRPSIYDTKVQRFRFQFKEKLFFYLCFGVEEMRELIEQLNQQQKRLLQANTYEICRKLTFQIDLQMLRILNKSDRYEVTREYKLQFENLLNNLRDQSNSELKRRIVTKAFLPSRIAIANQIQFFTMAKREQILEKQKKYIAQFTVDNVLMPFDQRNEEVQEKQQPQAEPQREEIPTLKPQKSGLSNKYIDQASILQIQELLSQNQLQKMLNRLEEDLQGRSKTVLMGNFKEVFSI